MATSAYPQLSTGLADHLAGGGSLKSALDGGRIRVFNGTPPANPDLAATGTVLWTITVNGDGTDHGWGGHHFVMGGAVQGQRYYGLAPAIAVNGADDVGQGRLLPTTSVDQYAATFANWMGIPNSDLAWVMPNIGSFSNTNLGFV